MKLKKECQFGSTRLTYVVDLTGVVVEVGVPRRYAVYVLDPKFKGGTFEGRVLPLVENESLSGQLPGGSVVIAVMELR